ncbi:hypothetical protein [Cysteiniphilum halobium]|uniref:hypothetical protein n=1 Tax=Cysteiniphilum halobium TaxID=2219059 RepID=UPI003F85B783
MSNQAAISLKNFIQQTLEDVFSASSDAKVLDNSGHTKYVANTPKFVDFEIPLAFCAKLTDNKEKSIVVSPNNNNEGAAKIKFQVYLSTKQNINS